MKKRLAAALMTWTYASMLRASWGRIPLVLFGGGNTSVKTLEAEREILQVKGSGNDLAHVRRRDFTPVQLERVRPLIDHDDLSNEELAQAVAHCVVAQNTPRASIETLLHA